VQVNDKVVLHIKLGKKYDRFTVFCLKSDELQFLDIFSVNKIAVLCTVDLLYHVFSCITETSQVTNDCTHIARGPHVGQPRFKMSLKSEAVYNSSACKFDVLYFVNSTPDTLD